MDYTTVFISDPGAWGEQSILSTDFDAMEATTEAAHAEPKVNTIDADLETYTTSGNWPDGTWERGLFADESWWYKDLHPVTFQYWTAHTRVRRSCEFGRGYIWANWNGYTFSGRETQRIKNAVDYLRSVQISGDPWDSSRDGSWIGWTWRAGYETLILDEEYWAPPGTDNRVDLNWFDVGRCLAFISMAHVQAVQDGESVQGDLDYTDPVDKGYANLVTEVGSIGVTSGNPNANYHAAALWGLAAAYKAGRSVSLAHCYQWQVALISAQDTNPASDHYGCFYDPANTDTDGSPAQEFYHDCKVNYHGINLRGLAEAYGLWTPGAVKDAVREALILAINHVIDKRFAPDNSLYTNYRTTGGDPPNASNDGTQTLELMVAALCRVRVEAEADSAWSDEDKARLMEACSRMVSAFSKTGRYWFAGWGIYKATMDWVSAGASDSAIRLEMPDEDPISDPGTYATLSVLDADIETMHSSAESVNAPAKITSVSLSPDSVGTTGNWPSGAYEQGYYDGSNDWFNTTTNGSYLGSRPRARRTWEFASAYPLLGVSSHVYSFNEYTMTENAANWLIDQQFPNGAWANWIYRVAQDQPSNNDEGASLDATDLQTSTTTDNSYYHYSTMAAVCMIAQYYAYGIMEAALSSPTASLDTVLSDGLTYLLGSEFDPDTGGTDPWQTSPYFNTNVYGTVAYAAMLSYNANNSLVTMSEIERRVEAYADCQVRVGTWKGTWLQADRVDTINGEDFYHDTRAVYHATITNRLAHLYAYLPAGNARVKLRAALRLAMNHLIDNVVNSDGTLQSFYLTTSENAPTGDNATATETIPEACMAACWMAYNAKHDATFTSAEQDKFEELADKIAQSLSAKSSRYHFKALALYREMKDNLGGVTNADMWLVPGLVGDYPGGS